MTVGTMPSLWPLETVVQETIGGVMPAPSLLSVAVVYPVLQYCITLGTQDNLMAA